MFNGSDNNNLNYNFFAITQRQEKNCKNITHFYSKTIQTILKNALNDYY